MSNKTFEEREVVNFSSRYKPASKREADRDIREAIQDLEDEQLAQQEAEQAETDLMYEVAETQTRREAQDDIDDYYSDGRHPQSCLCDPCVDEEMERGYQRWYEEDLEEEAYQWWFETEAARHPFDCLCDSCCLDRRQMEIDSEDEYMNEIMDDMYHEGRHDGYCLCGQCINEREDRRWIMEFLDNSVRNEQGFSEIPQSVIPTATDDILKCQNLDGALYDRVLVFRAILVRYSEDFDFFKGVLWALLSCEIELTPKDRSSIAELIEDLAARKGWDNDEVWLIIHKVTQNN